MWFDKAIRTNNWHSPVSSESEPSVEGAGVSAPPLQSDLRPPAVLGADPDHHLPALPGAGLPLGATAELV